MQMEQENWKLEVKSKDSSSRDYLCKGKQRNGIGRKKRILMCKNFFKVAI